MLALTALDSAAQLRPSKRSSVRTRLGFALAAASSAGLAHVIRQSQQVKDQVEDALVEGLGVDYAEQLDAVPTPAELATPWRTLVNPFNFKDREVQVEKDIAYAEFGRRSMLDIYRPAKDEQLADAPVLLQVHGGAWILGKKDQQGIPLMQHMAQRGWVCVAINYRLAPRDPFPAHVIDVKRAIAWIKENIAEYGGNPDYIVDHRRLGGRPPRHAGRGHAQRQGVAAGLRGRRHLASRPPSPTTASTTWPAPPGCAARRACATASSHPRSS